MISMIFRKGNVSTAKDVLTQQNNETKDTGWGPMHNLFAPIYLKDCESSWKLEWQEAFLNFQKERLDLQVKEAFQIVKAYFLHHISPLFQSKVYAKLVHFGITGEYTLMDAVWKLISNVPIYLVTNEMKKDGIPKKTFKIPEIIGDDFDPFQKAGKISIKRGFPTGCYENELLKIPHSLDNIKDGIKIFIWVDNIWNEVNSAKIKDFKYFFTYVLAHELTHALLDVYDETPTNCTHMRIFDLYREESIAEGYALLTMQAINTDFANSLICYKKSKKYDAYNLGLAFATEDVLKAAIHNWMSIKSGRPITKDAARIWLSNSKDFLTSTTEDIINCDNALYNSAQTNP